MKNIDSRKFSAILFSSFSLGLTAYGILQPGYYIDLLISSDISYLLIRAFVSALLLSYLLFPQVRTHLVRNIMTAMGACFLAIGLVSCFSPTVFGNLVGYITLGDTVIFVEGGVLSLLASLELSAHSAPASSRLQLRLPTIPTNLRRKLAQSPQSAR